jgi:hypothetical protein
MAPAILILVLGIAAAGCGQADGAPQVATATGTQAGGGGRIPDPVEQARRYADCLRREGVTMQQPAQGPPEMDKARTPVATAAAATEHCRQLAPVTEAAPRLSARDLEQRRRHSACLRAHGVPEYPDPDPATGEPTMTQDAAIRLKTNPHFASALEACRAALPVAPAGEAVRGG